MKKIIMLILSTNSTDPLGFQLSQNQLKSEECVKY